MNKRAFSKSLSNASRGFTLLELVVALALFAMMSAIAYSGLNNVLTARDRTDEQAMQLVHLQTAFTYIARDLSQVVKRGIRDSYGEPSEPLVGRDISGYLIELTHTGWRNPIPMEERPRSSLQRVAYKLEDDNLIRAFWPVLDRSQDSQPIENVLLEDVTKLEFGFLDSINNQKWHTSWPQPATGGANADPSPPKAVKMTIETKVFGTIERLFVIPG